MGYLKYNPCHPIEEIHNLNCADKQRGLRRGWRRSQQNVYWAETRVFKMGDRHLCPFFLFLKEASGPVLILTTDRKVRLRRSDMDLSWNMVNS